MNSLSAPKDSGPNDTGAATPGPRPWVRITRVCALLIMLIFVTGIIAGYIDAHQDAGGGPYKVKAIAILSGFAAVALAALIQLVRDLRALTSGIKHLPPREQVTVKFLTMGVAFGLISGIGIVILDIGVGSTVSLSPAVAIIASLFLVTAGSWITWRWWLAIDEHEQAAYTLGANISAHFVMMAGIIWWMLNLGGIVPPPNVMLLIIAMSFVWTGVWLYRKFF